MSNWSYFFFLFLFFLDEISLDLKYPNQSYIHLKYWNILYHQEKSVYHVKQVYALLYKYNMNWGQINITAYFVVF